MQPNAQLKAVIKSPFVPLFQRDGFLFRILNPSLEKHALSQVEGRGRGDFEGTAEEFCD